MFTVSPTITDFFINIRDQLWSGPLLFLLVATGLYQTINLRWIQLRYFGKAITLVISPIKKEKHQRGRVKGDISSFQSLMTALAGAIGTGNITGIATAVALGGFGSLFWMWIIALLGMASAYSEALLAVKYREKNIDGNASGGPMYTLRNGLNFKILPVFFCVFAILASFGLGATIQSNSVADALFVSLNIEHLYTGIGLAFLVGLVVLGGISTIGRVAGVLVPFMAILYLLSGCWVLLWNINQLPEALALIITTAFTGQAAMGGFVGSSMLLAMQYGVSKGIFSNEAGLGSLAIAAASAQTEQPAKQGMYAIAGVFISTMVVCTITGLVLAVTQVLGQVDAQGHLLNGSALAIAAFVSVAPILQWVVVACLILFAFTTILAWAYYGEKCVEYLFGTGFGHAYRWVHIGTIILGALLKLELVWALADIANGLMAIPNLLAILLLSKVISRETQQYLQMEGK